MIASPFNAIWHNRSKRRSIPSSSSGKGVLTGITSPLSRITKAYAFSLPLYLPKRIWQMFGWWKNFFKKFLCIEKAPQKQSMFRMLSLSFLITFLYSDTLPRKLQKTSLFIEIFLAVYPFFRTAPWMYLLQTMQHKKST